MNNLQLLILLAGLVAASPGLLAQTPEPDASAAASHAPPNTNSGAAAVSASMAPTAALDTNSAALAITPAGTETNTALIPGINTAEAGANGPATGLAAIVPSQGTNGVAAPGTNDLGRQFPNQFIPNNVTNTTYNPDELHLNFRGVPLDMVLNYLSEAAGFTIVLEARPSGRVNLWSDRSLTRNEAVDLLNTVLNQNGFAAIRRGRTLTIVNRDEAKIRAIPVKTGSDPESIPDNDEMVTQIIPVRYVEVTQLIKDLQPLVSVQTPMTANESGNSIVITDTQSNIRRVAEVIQAIDMGAEDVTVVRVFKLNYADPSEMADLLTSLFPDDSRSGGGSQSPIQFGRMFGGRGGRGGGSPFGGGAPSGGNDQSQRLKKRARVLAVPDARTASIIVSAARDLMEQIQGVVEELDANPRGKKTVSFYKLQNTDPSEAMQVLQDIFQKNGTTTSRNSANQTSVLQNRSTQQNQQYSTGGRSTTGRSSSRSGGMGSFGN